MSIFMKLICETYYTLSSIYVIPRGKLTGYLIFASFSKWMLTHPLSSLPAQKIPQP